VRAKVNDAAAQDFVVDTGAENTVITRPTAQRLGITPVTYTLSAARRPASGWRAFSSPGSNRLEARLAQACATSRA